MPVRSNLGSTGFYFTFDCAFIRFTMRVILVISLFIFAGLAGLSASAQTEPLSDGGKYLLHTVVRKETVYSLCQKYHITLKELEAANPGIEGILQSGSVVKIPVFAATVPSSKKQMADEFYYHKVQKQQTLYSIARQYGLTESEIIRYNPLVAEGLKVGQILKIPAKPNQSQGAGMPEATSAPASDGNFLVHQVVSGETLFSLEKQYAISDEEMIRLNPELKNGLKTGMKLRIPAKAEQTAPEISTARQPVAKYQVEKGETIFSIASRFGLEVTDLKKANPVLYTRGVQTGETLLVPEQTKKTVAPTNPVPETQTAQYQTVTYPNIPVVSTCLPDPATRFKKYKVALLMPFYLPEKSTTASDSLAAGFRGQINGKRDSAAWAAPIYFNNQRLSIGADTAVALSGIHIDPRATGFLEFYEGAILALDSIRRSGMNVEMYVFDASNAKQVNRTLQNPEFLDMSLIIGPVHPELQAIVAGFASKNRIAMVSPLAGTGNFERNNSWFLKAVPDRNFQIEQTARYISDELRNRNFILLKETGVNPSVPEARLGQLCKTTLTGEGTRSRFHEYDFQQQDITGIGSLLDPAGDNVFVIPSDNEAQVSVDVANLNALAGHYPVVLMGTATLAKMKSVQTENYHQVRLRYLSPFYVDYKSPLVRRLVGRYRDVFAGEPSQFSFQGFDVAFYFMSALRLYGRDFRGCLPGFPMALTQMNFDFRKVAPMGGYVNESLFVVSYERNFDILNYGVFKPQN
jgi:LysM repeat protein/ABC-type branched-subunit amino acid transport system substrate-binding protein